MPSQWSFYVSVIAAFFSMCFKIDLIHAVEILINYAVSFERVEDLNPAVLGEIYLPNLGWHEMTFLSHPA